MKKKLLLLFVPVFLLSAVLHAEVFSLNPFHGNDPWMTDSPDALLHPSTLWTELINVNGQNVEMNVALVSMKLDSCMELLKKNFPEASLAGNPNSCVMEVIRKDGMRERRLLLAASGIYPVIQFTMVLPKDASARPEDWPDELPLPPGSVPVTVMKFPKRNAVYGLFESTLTREQALARITSVLKTGGWTVLSGESASGANGSGEIFMHAKKNKWMIVGLAEGSTGKLNGTLYMRPLKE